MPGPSTKRRHREKKRTSTPQYIDQSHIIESNREVLESENNFEESGNRQERDLWIQKSIENLLIHLVGNRILERCLLLKGRATY